jgi:hypothetical protein
VRADRLVAAGSARALLSPSVHRPERRGGQGGEGARPLRHGGGDALAAGQPAHQQVPGIALVLLAAHRAHLGPPVPAAHIGLPVDLVRRRVALGHLTGRGVDQRGRTPQPHRPRIPPDPLHREVGRHLGQERGGRYSRGERHDGTPEVVGTKLPPLIPTHRDVPTTQSGRLWISGDLPKRPKRPQNVPKTSPASSRARQVRSPQHSQRPRPVAAKSASEGHLTAAHDQPLGTPS